jgi:hypothetical protein
MNPGIGNPTQIGSLIKLRTASPLGKAHMPSIELTQEHFFAATVASLNGMKKTIPITAPEHASTMSADRVAINGWSAAADHSRRNAIFLGKRPLVDEMSQGEISGTCQSNGRRNGVEVAGEIDTAHADFLGGQGT